MLNGIKYRLAFGLALAQMERRGRISPQQRKLMGSIAGNRINCRYGKDLIRTGAARDNHAAAAAVFARLALSTPRTPHLEIAAETWEAASRRALENGGATETESFLFLPGLKRSIAEADAAADAEFIGR